MNVYASGHNKDFIKYSAQDLLARSDLVASFGSKKNERSKAETTKILSKITGN